MNARKLLSFAAARSRRATFVLTVLLVVAAGAAQGDWLVLASGEAVETKGPWTVEGRKIVFTSTRGVLSSVRASSVDVDSSRELTTKKQEEASRVVVPVPTPKRTPVLVLTDADFAKKPAAPDAAGTTAGEPGVESAAAREPVVVPAADSIESRLARQMPGAPALQIMSWSARPTGEDQLSIFGTVQNVGSLVTAAITIGVKLIDSEGAAIGTREGAVTATALMPGAQADFEARFEGDPNFSIVEFTVDTVQLEIGRPEGGEELEQPLEEQPAEEEPADAPPRGERTAAPARGDEPHARAERSAPAPGG